MSTIWFVVDDTDPRLNYSGSAWSFVPNTGAFNDTTDNEADIDAISRTGPAFNSTLHRITGNGTVSFRFNGSSSLGVYGTIDAQVAPTLAVIECTLDGADVLTVVPVFPKQFKNNNIACQSNSSQPGSSPGEHELIINVTNIISDWYFDYIVYESLVNPALDGETLQAGNGELTSPSNYSMLTFGTGWVPNTNDSGTSTVTTIQGSEATMKFNGTSLSLYGGLNGSTTNTATYTVIGERSPVTFELLGSPSGPLSNQLLFTASNLSAGEHTVVVTLNGTSEGVPLDVDYFLVTSLTTAQQASLSSPSPSTATTLQKTDSSKPHTGLIAGVSVGAVIAIFTVAVAVWLIRRSKRLKRQERFDVVPFKSKDMHPDPGSAMYKKHPPEFVSAQPHVIIGNGQQPSPANILTMKLQQRLAVVRDQIEQRDRQLAEGSALQHGQPIVHAHSGSRGIEEAFDPGLTLEVPPGYTQD